MYVCMYLSTYLIYSLSSAFKNKFRSLAVWLQHQRNYLRYTRLPNWKIIEIANYEVHEEIQQIIKRKKNKGCITMQVHGQWLHIQANESSWPRTHTPWQRCTPHSPTTTKTDDLWCSFQAITQWAWESQSVSNPKVESNSVTILRNSRVFTRLKVIFCKLGRDGESPRKKRRTKKNNIALC
jgi:hypothetical protein